MNSEVKLQMQIAEMILSVAAEQPDLTQSDFQSRVDVVAQKIIQAVRRGKQLREASLA